jgi:hypothetical protein
MRYLFFAPFISIALVMYFFIRRYYVKADPEKIYVGLCLITLAALGPSLD